MLRHSLRSAVAMRISYAFLLAIPSALSIPIPSTYEWSLTSWSGEWYGIGWANFRVDGPQATISGVAVPALSLTDVCHVVSSQASNCNDLIAGNTDGRTLEVAVVPFNWDLRQIQVDFVYRFTSNGKYASQAQSGRCITMQLTVSDRKDAVKARASRHGQE